MEKTIAFSTKSLDWKTEYSFTPKHYARTRDTMISFLRNEDGSGVHTHDTNSDRNKLYGVQHDSSLTIVTNEDPSATKIYEAFSVESTTGDWSVNFSTDTTSNQSSSIASNDLVEREGTHYRDIPKNKNNDDVAVVYVGNTTAKNLIDSANSLKIKLTNRLHNMPSLNLGFAANNKIYFFTSLGFLVNNAPENTVFEGYDGYSNSLSINKSHSLISTALSGFSDDDIVSLYTQSDTEMNGEDMRGKYMKISLQRSGGGDYELYAINVDQHKTKLDHSLGQNN